MMRKEIKFHVTRYQFDLLYKLLSQFYKPDDYGASYIVKSQYFDTYDEAHLTSKLSGEDRIGKIRIRQYNDQSTFKLEYKQKKGQYVFKESKVLSEEAYEALLAQPKLIKEYFPLVSHPLKSRSIIRYKRHALVDERLNMRLTFDEGICLASKGKNLLECSHYLSSERLVFEIKYSHVIPHHVQRIIQDLGVEESISKYVVLTNQYEGVK